MRRDAIGLFWEDLPPVKQTKEEIKRQPPPRVWLQKDYLPDFENAKAFKVAQFTGVELWMNPASEPLMYDIEVYPNYVQIGFMGLHSGKVIDFELSPSKSMNLDMLAFVLSKFTCVSFNGMYYDRYIIPFILAGRGSLEMWDATCELIQLNMPGWMVLRRHKLKEFQFDHIDVREVCPGFGSLKQRYGRIFGKRMQDLPYAPGTFLTYEQSIVVRYYNVNDLKATAALYNEMQEQIQLRVEMNAKYGFDVRSKSDAQIAERIIGYEYERLTGVYPKPQTIEPGTAYRYQVPGFIEFKTPLMQKALDIIRNSAFIVAETGNIGMPPTIKALKLRIGESVYTLGIGGLHSNEKRTSYVRRNGWRVTDRDVTSFYPMIILLLRLFPENMGAKFLEIYSNIYGERVTHKGLIKQWKEAGNKERENMAKIASETLKIVLNGGFGKLGSMFSLLYSARLLIQVTITGQLSILMLIERLELAGIRVVSANTDGFVTYSHDEQQEVIQDVVAKWVKDTGFALEETEYDALYSRDVNSYIALQPKGQYKAKGSFKDPWGQKAIGMAVGGECIKHNPKNQICVTAVVHYLRDGVPLEKTIRECTDINRFVTIGYSKEGAAKVWENGYVEYLGKNARWYYSTTVTDCIQKADSGDMLPNTMNARPCQDLPVGIPDDLDYDWYIAEAGKYLKELGQAS